LPDEMLNEIIDLIKRSKIS